MVILLISWWKKNLEILSVNNILLGTQVNHVKDYHILSFLTKNSWLLQRYRPATNFLSIGPFMLRTSEKCLFTQNVQQQVYLNNPPVIKLISFSQSKLCISLLFKSTFRVSKISIPQGSALKPLLFFILDKKCECRLDMDSQAKKW